MKYDPIYQLLSYSKKTIGAKHRTKQLAAYIGKGS